MAVEQLGGQTPDGVTIGADSADKCSVYGETPVIQASAITAPASTAAISTNSYGFTTSTQADAIQTALNSVLTALSNFGITA